MYNHSDLFIFLKKVDVKKIEECLSQGNLNLNTLDEEGNPPLFYATNKEVLAILKNHNADPTILNSERMDYLQFTMEKSTNFFISSIWNKINISIDNEVNQVDIIFNFIDTFNTTALCINSFLNKSFNFLQSLLKNNLHNFKEELKNDCASTSDIEFIISLTIKCYNYISHIVERCVIEYGYSISSKTLESIILFSKSILDEGVEELKSSKDLEDMINNNNRLIFKCTNTDNISYVFASSYDEQDEKVRDFLLKLIIDKISYSNLLPIISQIYLGDKFNNKNYLLKPIFEKVIKKNFLKRELINLKIVQNLIEDGVNLKQFNSILNELKSRKDFNPQMFEQIIISLSIILSTNNLSILNLQKLVNLKQFSTLKEIPTKGIKNIVSRYYGMNEAGLEIEAANFVRVYLNNNENKFKMKEQNEIHSELIASEIANHFSTEELYNVIVEKSFSPNILDIFLKNQTKETIFNINKKINQIKYLDDIFLVIKESKEQKSAMVVIDEEKSIKLTKVLLKYFDINFKNDIIENYPPRLGSLIVSTATCYNKNKFITNENNDAYIGKEIKIEELISICESTTALKSMRINIPSDILENILKENFGSNRFENSVDLIEGLYELIKQIFYTKEISILDAINNSKESISNITDLDKDVNWIMLNLIRYGLLDENSCKMLIEIAKDKINLQYNNLNDESKQSILLYAIDNNMVNEISPLIKLISEKFMTTGIHQDINNVRSWLQDLIAVSTDSLTVEQIKLLNKASLLILTSIQEISNKDTIKDVEEKTNSLNI